MDARLRTFLIRSAFLFLISLVLVAGFWYHREFYQIGFTNLLVIGWFGTLFVLSPARLPITCVLPLVRWSRALTFTLDGGDRLLKRCSRPVARASQRLDGTCI